MIKKNKKLDWGKWKEFRYSSLNECNCDQGTPEKMDEERYKHEGNFVSTRDIYDYLQENGLFNKDFEVEIDTGGQIEHPVKIISFRIENGKFIIETE